MVGILSRFHAIMSSNVQQRLHQSEDLEKTIDDYMRQVHRDLSELKAEAASVLAAEQRAKRALDECKQEMDKYERYAEKSVQSGNDTAALKFLNMKAELMKKVPQLQAAYDSAVNETESIRKMQEKLEQDVQELEKRRAKLKEKLTATKQVQSMHKKNSSTGNPDALFRTAEEKINFAYEEAMALAELRSDKSDDLDEAFAQLEKEKQAADNPSTATTSAEEELAALKQKWKK